MTVTVRMSTYRFDPAKRAEHAELGAEKRRLWAEALTQEPGYLGEICVEAGADRQVVLHFWSSPETADAALARNNPRLRQLITAHFLPDYDTLWTTPPEHLMGTLLTDTFSQGRA
ncbi:MAG TPA: hypothetical protein VIL85_18085 [Thermomicrobiales bacterium]|jgi:hypothetical protein